MRIKLLVNPRAQLDVAHHYTYLLSKNTMAADRFRAAMKAALKRIEKEQRSCPKLDIDGFDHLELRFCRPKGFNNYLVVFQVTDTGPIALRVLHASQDITAALQEAS